MLFVYHFVKGLPNITISHKTCVSNRSITLSGDVFLYESFPAVQNVFWTKDGKKLDTEEIGGKYTEVRADDLSLTILEVNKHDDGSYQLTATNAVGSTSSDIIILGIKFVDRIQGFYTNRKISLFSNFLINKR